MSEQGKSYLLTSVEHAASQPSDDTGEAGGASYSNRFTCIADSVQFRPARRTPRPVISGVQTAVVVGPPGDEIYTDKYGRVKVQFHWDRVGQEGREQLLLDARRRRSWAGKGWGSVVDMPRIGQEVIVEFLEGDPDQPIITGRVYNAEQMPPYELPANKTQSGIKSRSSQGRRRRQLQRDAVRGQEGRGAALHPRREEPGHRGRERRDALGRARSQEDDRQRRDDARQADRTETVDNNETITIGGNRTETVGKNETITIGAATGRRTSAPTRRSPSAETARHGEQERDGDGRAAAHAHRRHQRDDHRRRGAGNHRRRRCRRSRSAQFRRSALARTSRPTSARISRRVGGNQTTQVGGNQSTTPEATRRTRSTVAAARASARTTRSRSARTGWWMPAIR